MRILLFAFALLVVNSTLFAQQPVLRCGTDEIMRKFLKDHPELTEQIKSENEKLEKSTRQMIKSAAKATDTPIYIIPVVFHIVHNNGPENISDVQVLDQIRIFNEDFRKWNADTVDIINQFKALSGNAKVEFRLAEIDPFGNATKGIVREQSIYTNDPSPDHQYEGNVKSDIWPRSKYLNIWSCLEIGGPAGYSYYPSNIWPGASLDGIMVLYNHVGSLTPSSPSNSRTLTHEAGHWINLKHTWGDSNEPGCDGTATNTTDPCYQINNCNTDDGVGDTPNTIGWTSCDLNGTTCGSLDNVQNYMEYAYCDRMFTWDQVDRMRAALQASTAGRSNIWTDVNLTSTGVDDNSAVFFAGHTIVCAGEPVNFYDYSYNGMMKWNWVFPGAVTGTANTKNPVTTYMVPGKYNVMLSVINTLSTYTTNKLAYITVTPPYSLPYYESFENGLNVEARNRWGGYTWQITNAASYYGSNSIMLNNLDNPVFKDFEDMVSPPIDITPLVSGKYLKFKTAYVQKTDSTNDKLWLFISYNNGQTWMTVWSKTGATLASAPMQTTAFTPADTTQWKSWSLQLLNSSEKFRYKFEFRSENGNNIYMDDISITGNYGKVPILISPANFSVNNPVSLKLDWNSVTAVDSYQVQIDSTDTFASPFLITSATAYISSSGTNTDTEHDLAALDSATYYYWRVRTFTASTPSVWSSVWRFKTQMPSGISEEGKAISTLEVFPNPVTRSSVLKFKLTGTQCPVSIEIVDIFGRSIRLKTLSLLEPGTYSYHLPPLSLPGVYLIKMNLQNENITRKILVQ